MAYRKRKLAIRKRDNAVEFVNGYEFDVCFSEGTLFSVGVFKSARKHNLWTVTDVNTGYAICYGNSRVDAVRKFQQTYLHKLERMVFSNERYTPLKPENWYETKTAEFAKLVEGVRS